MGNHLGLYPPLYRCSKTHMDFIFMRISASENIENAENFQLNLRTFAATCDIRIIFKMK